MTSWDLSDNWLRGDIGDRFRRLVEEAPNIVMLLDPDLTVRYASPAIERVLGYGPEYVTGTSLTRYLHQEQKEWARGILLAERAEPGKAQTPAELRIRHANGAWCRFEVTSVDLLDEPSVRGVAVYCHDVTDDRALRDELTHRSFHDALTGLPNRVLFENRLKHALARTARHQGTVTILFLDLDDFKLVNDRYGHEIGDQLLVAIGRRLQSCVRPGDTVARFGGDEFAILIEHAIGPVDAAKVVERIVRTSRAPVAVAGHSLFVTASIGVASGRPGQGQAQELLRRADAAMYRAKKEGKTHYELFEEDLSEVAHGHSNLGDDLKEAFERGELRVHYQPGVSLKTGKIVGMEALLRWDYQRDSPVSPAELVASAEMSGLITPIGRWVLEEACRQALLWQDRYPDAPPTVSVNLSTRQLLQPALPREVAAILRKTGLDPHNLALEVEEGFSAGDAPYVAATVEKLKELGVSLTVDDFGRGHSSLSDLERFSVDTLKIDRLFIGRLGRGGGKTEKLVSAMIGFARAMDIRAVAEGVETAEQLASLRRMGCDLAQGFYFWRPLPGEAATKLLESHGTS